VTATELCAPHLTGRFLLEYLETRGGLFQTLQDTLSEEAKERLLLATVKESETASGRDGPKLELMKQLNRCWLQSLAKFRRDGPTSDARDILRILDLGLASCAKPAVTGLRDSVQFAFVENFKRPQIPWPKLQVPERAHPALARRVRQLRVRYEQYPDVRDNFLASVDQVLGERADVCLAADNILEASNENAHFVVLVCALAVLSRFQFSDLGGEGAFSGGARVANHLEARAVLSIYEQLAACLGALQAEPQLTASCLLRMKDFARRWGLSRLPSFRLRFRLAVQRFLSQCGLRDEEREAFGVLKEDLLPLPKSSFLKAAVLCHLNSRVDEIAEKKLLYSMEFSLHRTCLRDGRCRKSLLAMQQEIVDLACFHDRLVLFFRSFEFGDNWFEKHLATHFHASGRLQEMMPLRSKRFHSSQTMPAARQCLEYFGKFHRSPFFQAVWFYVNTTSQPCLKGLKEFFERTSGFALREQKCSADATFARAAFALLALRDFRPYFCTVGRRDFEKDAVLFHCEKLRDTLRNLAGPRHHCLPLVNLCLDVVAFFRRGWLRLLRDADQQLLDLRTVFEERGLPVPAREAEGSWPPSQDLSPRSSRSSLSSLPPVLNLEDDYSLDGSWPDLPALEWDLPQAEVPEALPASEPTGGDEALKRDLEKKWAEAEENAADLRRGLSSVCNFVCPHSDLADLAGFSAHRARDSGASEEPSVEKRNLSVPEELSGSLLFLRLQRDRLERFEKINGDLKKSAPRPIEIVSRLRSCSSLDFCLEIVNDPVLSLGVLEGYSALSQLNPSEGVFY
jgi:hypothetical protein